MSSFNVHILFVGGSDMRLDSLQFIYKIQDPSKSCQNTQFHVAYQLYINNNYIFCLIWYSLMDFFIAPLE